MSSTGWTNNAELCIAKWFTSDFGMNIAWTDLDEPSVIASSNICDERVLTQGSTTFTVELEGSPGAATDSITLIQGSRALDVGDGVRVSSSGSLPGGLVAATTYYAIPSTSGSYKLASSVANAFAGTPVDITTAGTGTLTLSYYDEARYKLNGSYTLDAPKGDVLQQLLSAMAGVVVYIGGKWFIHAGAAATPTVTLTEDDLRGDLTYIPKRSMRDRSNGVRAVYVNPSANWQPVDAPPLQNAIYLAEDAGKELYEDIRLPFTTSTPTAQRLMKINLERNRRQGIVHFPAKLTAMRLQPWDGVYLTIERYGWDQKQFRVMGWALAEDGGIDLTLQEDDADVYAWTAAEETASALQQGVVLPDGSVLSAPAAVTVLTWGVPTFTKIPFEWDEVASIWLDGYDIEYRSQGAVDWTSYGFSSATAARKATVDKTVPADFRVRAVATNRVESNWTENLAPGVPTSVTSPAGGQITWVNGSGAFEIQFFKDGVFFERVSFTPASRTGLGAGTYQLRTLNSGGNMSALSSQVVLGGGGGDAGGDDGDDGSGGGDDGQ